jgi:ABC-type nickel/cobalt efflux system permease component RcnA
MQFFSALTSPFTAFLSEDPQVAMTQAGLMALVVIVLFLLFYTLRDIILRSRSFVYQCFCILLVALLPGVGFLIYLLIRPARTVKQREMEAMVEALTVAFFGTDEESVADEDEEGEEVVPSPKTEKHEEKPHDAHEHAHHAKHHHS